MSSGSDIELPIPTWFLLLVAAFVFWYLKSTGKQRVWKSQGIVGPHPTPFFGNSLHFFRKAVPVVDKELIEKFGKVVGIYYHEQPGLLIADPNFIQQALIGNLQSMPNRCSSNESGFLLALPNLRDDHWKHVRGILSSAAFITDYMDKMKPMMESCVDSLVQNMKSYGDQPITIIEFTSCYSMDVLCDIIFGMHIDSHNNPSCMINEKAKNLMNSRIGGMKTIKKVVQDLCPPSLKCFLSTCGVEQVPKEALEYFLELGDRILADSSTSNGKDFITLCGRKFVSSEASSSNEDIRVNHEGTKWNVNGLTRDEILANAISIFRDGYLEISATLQFFFYEMAMNLEIQEQVHDELKSIAPSGNLINEELEQFKLLNQCLEETMRLYPPYPRFDRHTSEHIDVEGIFIPKGTTLIVSTYALHRDPQLWVEPEDFNPDRFSMENQQSRHPCAYIPFGIGDRSCVGNRLAFLILKVAAAKVMRNFRLESCDETMERDLCWAISDRLVPQKELILRAIPR